MSGADEPTADVAALVPVRGLPISVRARTARLLHISRGLPTSSSPAAGIPISIDWAAGEVRGEKMEPHEPSMIFAGLPIRQPSAGTIVPRPNYYPSYSALTPEQRWVYLEWLRDVSAPSDIGYVFLYYYGLERHLLVGEFDLAFDEIVALRAHHNHPSFQGYSRQALICSAILQHRVDRLGGTVPLDAAPDVDDTDLLVAYHMNLDLSPATVVATAERIPGTKRRYVRSHPDLFQNTLERYLVERYGGAFFPFAGRYDLDRLPRRQTILFANISFPDHVRSPELPSFLADDAFRGAVASLMEDVHERVKADLKSRRQAARRKA